MKKLTFLAFVLVFITFSCSGKPENHIASESDSPGSVQDSNELAVKTTLDSLQGEWHLKSDDKGVLKIAKDSAFNIYENEIVDKGEIFFGNECTEDFKVMNKQRGKYLIFHSDVFMCYEIEQVQANKLILLFNNNTLEYWKK